MSDMAKMPLNIAQQIYYNRYWEKMQLNDICRMSEALAIELFDSGVNMGIAKAVMMLQQVLNAFNNQGEYYPDLFEDGVIGRSTITALHAYYAKRGVKGAGVLLKTMNCLQGAYYIELCRKRQRNETFVFGWIANRVELVA
jgi:lysozyme family protein